MGFEKGHAPGLKAAAAAVCVFSVLLSACLNGFEPVSPEPEYETGYYFGRAQLDELDGGRDHLVDAYDRVVRALKGKRSIVEFSARDPVEVEDLKTVIDAVRSDRSDLYWLGNEYTYSYRDDKVLSVTLTVQTELADRDAVFREGVRDLLTEANLSPDMRPVDQELALHDALCAHVTYNEDAAHPSSAYGAVVEGEATCAGYAKAFQVLLREAGIPSFVLYGAADNEDGQVNHAWNLVRLGEDGYCYTDVTWDDSTAGDDEHEIPFYAYFNRSLEEFGADHRAESGFTLPAGSEDWNYYRQFPESGVEGTLHQADSGLNVSIVSQIRKNGTARMFLTDADPADAEKEFSEWFSLWGPAFANALGWKEGYTFAYSFMGKEFHLFIGPPSKKNS